MDNNIALISALFNEKGANFYKDIYFPIIRYSLVNLFFEHEEREKYFQIADLQNFIRNKFCIDIPIVVLRNSIVALHGLAQTDIVVETIGGQDDYLYLKKMDVDSQVNDAINRQAEIIEDNFLALERLFEQYLLSEHLDSVHNLYDFISECEEECYSMIVGDVAFKEKGIDANYSNIARFIDWLKTNRTDLYQYFTDIVWSAIISGFLRRQSFEFNIKPYDKVSYFLDSALVLSLLKLDTQYNVTYAHDVWRNIKASGGILKVHPMTIREVTRILDSVIREQGPRFGSAIAFGCIDNNFNLSNIVKIKNSLKDTLTNEFGIIIDNVSQQALIEAEKKLDTNKNVLYLSEKWGSNSYDKLREKHDIFMCENVNRINKDIVNAEKLTCFFITLNHDLIKLYHKSYGLSSVISPGNVVLKLWIHGTQNSKIRATVLTEIVSRCMALAQTDARRKIKLFCKYRKESEFSDQDIKDMYSGLIYRSNDLIMNFDELAKLDISNSEDKEATTTHVMNSIMESMRNESAERHRLFNEHAIVMQDLKETINTLETSIKAANEQNSNKEQIINNLKNEKNNNKLVIEQLRHALDMSEKKNNLTKEKDALKEQKKKMEIEREKSINMFSFWIKLILDIILLIALLFFCCIIILKFVNGEHVTINITTILATISLLGFLFRIRDAYWLNPKVKYSQCRKEQKEYWEENNPIYNELNSKIIELEKNIRSININNKNTTFTE